MKLDSKKLLSLVMYLPPVIAFGGFTVYGADKLAEFIEWGQFTIPASASYDSIVQALGYSFFTFLFLLGIPRGILYFKGTTKKRWTFLVYWAIPFVLLFILPDSILHYGLVVLAAVAWMEVLLVIDPLETLMSPRVSKR